MPGFLRKEPTIDELEALDEQLDKKLSVEEKKALIRQIKKQYGSDGIKLFKGGKEGGGIKSGIAWDEIKFRVR